MKYCIILFLVALSSFSVGQTSSHQFRIRTITAGINLSNLSDTSSLITAIKFLKKSREEYTIAGYEVQTIRVATQNLYQYLDSNTYDEALYFLMILDKIAQKDNVALSIGWLLPPNTYDPDIARWATRIIAQTQTISFSLPISSSKLGVHPHSVKAASEIIVAISVNNGGEGNFRFTASANCPPGIPFFPAAYHHGPNSFAIGLESPNLLKEVFSKSDWTNAKQNLKIELESKFRPVEEIALKIAGSYGNWIYDGIDTSPAPGLDASIAGAIEQLTHQPFGGPSTLRACALITDVLKNLELKTCGYSGLMLPVIEDKVLAKRANEQRFTVQEILLFSSVSGTGLDVIPLPGNTSVATIARILYDVAALSLKYTDKALSARLFLIPGKEAGDLAQFENPFLTNTVVMKVE